MTRFSQALEFRRKFKQHCLPREAVSVGVNDAFTLGMQFGLIEEESSEFKEAIEDWLRAGGLTAKAHALKELADLTYVCFQMAAFLSVDLDEALERVHASNMSKLDDNGEAIYNASGKVMKGPNYEKPNLHDLV
jgi:predicted HAD superfamily Cof-like phosphohydrolase